MDKATGEKILRWAKRGLAIDSLGGKCVTCGDARRAVLDFHHLKDKDETVSRLFQGRLTRLLQEISKCKLLCSNCHSEAHEHSAVVDDRKRRLKQKLLALKGGAKCNRCGYEKSIAALDFHHVGEKKFAIWDFIFNRRQTDWEDVLVEIENCEVLCRNCHRMEHFNNEHFDDMLPLIKSRLERYKERPMVDATMVIKMYREGRRRIDISRELRCSKSMVTYILGGEEERNP